MKTISNSVALVLICVFINACATYDLQTKGEQKSIDKQIALDHTFYLIGDAGYLDSSGSNPTLIQLKGELDKATENSTVIFLGDNIYPKGFSEENEKPKLILDAQINAVKTYAGQSIFIPGNHDWYSGVKGLKRQEKYVEDALGKNSFLPEDGCSIEKLELSDKLTLLIVDTQWFISDWDKLPNINDNCTFKTRDDFLDELESEIKKARGKTTLIALHHPMFSNGPHGGQFSFASHLKPVPVLGTLKNLSRHSKLI